jgi:uncharacterized protein (TIGR04255 family)
MPLDLPKADDRVAARSSVAMAICQIRFDEQDAIGSGATAVAFHERLGGEGGPYSKIESASAANRIMVAVGPGGPVQQPMTRQTGWSLEAEDGSWSLALLPDSMGLQTDEGFGAYKGWDDFLERLTKALAALQQVASPALEQRLGLRFVDRIPGTPLGVEGPSGWEPYITARFLGPIADPAIGRAAQFMQQHLLLDAGDRAICRMRHGLAAMLAADESRTEYVVDCDIYREGGRPFDVATILSTAEAFREQIDNLFGLVATPELLDKLTS